jgi:hypothetical protein
LRPQVRETDPRKTLVPCHGQWIVTRYRAPKGPAIESSRQGQIRPKAHPPGFKFKGVQRCANQDTGYLATNSKGSPLQSQPIEMIVPHEKEHYLS